MRNDRGYRILEEPHGTRRKLRVVFIGAGASGICFAKLHQDLLKDVKLQIYEKNADVGGTWLENKSDLIHPSRNRAATNEPTGIPV